MGDRAFHSFVVQTYHMLFMRQPKFAPDPDTDTTHRHGQQRLGEPQSSSPSTGESSFMRGELPETPADANHGDKAQ